MDSQNSTDDKQAPSKQTTTRKPRRKSGGALTAPTGMGGIDSGGGHDFQARYIVCHLPEWLVMPGFYEIFHEGANDVDIRYRTADGEHRHSIQIKDYDGGLRLTDLKEILINFVNLDNKMPGVYQRFIVACPFVHNELQPLLRAVRRIRDAKPFYDTTPNALKADEDELSGRIRESGLGAFASILLERVDFHVGFHDLGDDASCRNHFAGRLNSQPNYRDRLASAAAHSAYDALFTTMRGAIGTVVDREALESIIERAARGEKPLGEPAVHVAIHNWTKEKFDIHPDHVLNWSAYFDHDANPRRLPSPTEWQGILLPQLVALRSTLRANATRLIRFRGKCCLSTGIALGQIFSQRGNWQFEIMQPAPGQTEPVFWRSDGVVNRDYPLRVREVSPEGAFELDASSDAIALVVSVRRNSLGNATRYLAHHQVRVSALYEVQPEGGTGDLSVSGAEEALSIAYKVRSSLDEALDDHNPRTIHLFYNGPFGLAVFLGQQLNTVGDVQLYEFLGQGIGHAPSCVLST